MPKLAVLLLVCLYVALAWRWWRRERRRRVPRELRRYADYRDDWRR